MTSWRRGVCETDDVCLHELRTGGAGLPVGMTAAVVASRGLGLAA